MKRSSKREDAEYSSLYKHLRHGSRRQKRGNLKDKRGAIKDRVDISHRPDVVNDRKRIGDIEVDLMMGSEHKSALLVMTDRATLVTMIEKLAGKEAQEVYEKMAIRLTKFSSSWVKTLTFDNGKEFAQHKKIGCLLNTKTYFNRPYTSQDKGTVENRIGVIRRYFPKKPSCSRLKLLPLSGFRSFHSVSRCARSRKLRLFYALHPLTSKLVIF